jgi:hypothetical protein
MEIEVGLGAEEMDVTVRHVVSHCRDEDRMSFVMGSFHIMVPIPNTDSVRAISFTMMPSNRAQSIKSEQNGVSPIEAPVPQTSLVLVPLLVAPELVD